MKKTRKPKPERHGWKLTLSQVREMRRLQATDPKIYKLRVLGKMFNIRLETVCNIVNNHTWKDG